MSGSQVKRVMELAALPELSRLHPDDLATLALRLVWPGEGDPPPGDAVRCLLSGRATLDAGGAAVEAPALPGALEALAGARFPGLWPDADARIAWLGRADFRALVSDVFELWLALLRHAVARLIAVESDASEPVPGARQAPQPGDAELVQRIRLLAGCEFFADLRVHTLGRLAQGMEEQRVAAGTPLWEEGDAASRCLLVLEGRFARGSQGGSERPLAAPPGALLGLRPALADVRHASRLVATEAARVLCLPREHLIDELEDDPEAAEALLSAVARRTLAAEARAR